MGLFIATFTDPLAEDSEVQVVPRPAGLVTNPIVSPPGSVIKRKVASLTCVDDSIILPFMPPHVATVLKNEKGQRIVEVCIWVQSGVEWPQLNVFVADDMKTLKVQLRMDDLMTNGAGLHQDLVPRKGSTGRKRPTVKEIVNHVRVHHWNSLIDEMRSVSGLVPQFSCDIPLPEEVCSKKILRQAGKKSQSGAKVLLVDLLVEDSKVPRAEKRTFELVSDTCLGISDDMLSLRSMDDSSSDD